MSNNLSLSARALGLCGLSMTMLGCAAAPAPLVTPTTVVEPMTLPRYLGVTTIMRSAHTTLYRSRVCLARHVPLLEPRPLAAAPMALGDPAAMLSPAPAVAAAASVQQAEASAPGKIAALKYLASIDCSQHPQVEEAMLASLSDPVDSVRIAALEAIMSGQQRCGHTCQSCTTGCAGGCCTAAIHARLLIMANQQTDQGCWCEPNPTARRLARLALTNCSPATESLPQQSEERPPAAVVEMIGL